VQIDAIVPAHNEAETIQGVVSALASSPSVKTVVVIDDGSTDTTASVAQAAGAQVIRMPRNVGKGRAMYVGIGATTAPYVGFFDADLKGLTVPHVELLVATAVRGYGMVCGLRDRGIWNPLQLVMPIITGERVCARTFLQRVPFDCWSGYSIETAMNDAARRAQVPVALVWMDNLSIRDKTQKVGVARGLLRHARMFSEIYRTTRTLEVSCGSTCNSAKRAR
jgi:glycosyltransferase involved in cell wall biosynthesis